MSQHITQITLLIYILHQQFLLKYDRSSCWSWNQRVLFLLGVSFYHRNSFFFSHSKDKNATIGISVRMWKTLLHLLGGFNLLCGWSFFVLSTVIWLCICCVESTIWLNFFPLIGCLFAAWGKSASWVLTTTIQINWLHFAAWAQSAA